METYTTKRIYFLEAIRTLAALYVFVYHLLKRGIVENKILNMFFSFGQEFVMIFFVVSGFVIYYSMQSKSSEFNLKAYLKARVKRIYPVFCFSLLIAYLSMCFIENTWLDINISNLFGNIFMLQDFTTGKPGVLVKPYMGDTPLWSLSYEWWFYMLFIPVYVFFKKIQLHVVFVLSLSALLIYFIYPNQICLWCSYFILWWYGVEASMKYLFADTANRSWTIAYGLIILVVLIVYTLFIYEGKFEFGLFPILFIRHFFTALILYMVLVFVDVRRFQISEKNILVKLAPYSYAFYVLHYSLLNVFDAKKWFEYSGYTIVVLLAMLVLVTWFAEKVVHKYLNKCLGS